MKCSGPPLHYVLTWCRGKTWTQEGNNLFSSPCRCLHWRRLGGTLAKPACTYREVEALAHFWQRDTPTWVASAATSYIPWCWKCQKGCNNYSPLCPQHKQKSQAKHRLVCAEKNTSDQSRSAPASWTFYCRTLARCHAASELFQRPRRLPSGRSQKGKINKWINS